MKENNFFVRILRHKHKMEGREFSGTWQEKMDTKGSVVATNVWSFLKSVLFCEANNLPFKNKWFDKYFAYGCFMYFPSIQYVEQVIKEMRRVTKGTIYIGELPKESHEPKHLLFTEKDMEKLGLKTIKGWAEPYMEIRFSAYERLAISNSREYFFQFSFSS